MFQTRIACLVQYEGKNYLLYLGNTGAEVGNTSHTDNLHAAAVKSFNFVGMKFWGLTTMDTWIHGIQIIRHITKVTKYFVGILNSWIALPMKKNLKLNVERINMISQ